MNQQQQQQKLLQQSCCCTTHTQCAERSCIAVPKETHATCLTQKESTAWCMRRLLQQLPYAGTEQHLQQPHPSQTKFKTTPKKPNPNLQLSQVQPQALRCSTAAAVTSCMCKQPSGRSWRSPICKVHHSLVHAQNPAPTDNICPKDATNYTAPNHSPTCTLRPSSPNQPGAGLASPCRLLFPQLHLLAGTYPDFCMSAARHESAEAELLRLK